jgi:predicted transcriptional regulator
MSDTQRIAELAQRLLKDETVQDVLAMMRDEAIHRWEQGQSSDAREAAWHDREAVKRFERNLQALADRGVVEQITEQRRK